MLVLFRNDNIQYSMHSMPIYVVDDDRTWRGAFSSSITHINQIESN